MIYSKNVNMSYQNKKCLKDYKGKLKPLEINSIKQEKKI
jgi:hypothetical protein